MSCNYFVSKTTEEHVHLYFKCFLDDIFCKNYNIFIHPAQFESVVLEIALKPYKGLQRFVLFYKESLISFCHFYYNDDMATVSGGILPELTDTGRGIFAAAIFYDFIFNSTPTQALIVEIKKSNTRSIRMHKAFGFEEIDSKNKVQLKLLAPNFPNFVASKILSKIHYEYR